MLEQHPKPRRKSIYLAIALSRRSAVRWAAKARDCAMDKPHLIQIVRGLDQTGPGANGEHLQLLWSCLAAASDSQFHAAEESSLRWLLKSMNGASPSVETLRRYPLTWTILDCVFQRIPLFSLAKSLADRRFTAVLQQTLKDISKPAAESGSPTSKRKRTPAVSYSLDDLQARDGCLETARAVFGTLKSLLGRLDSPVAGFSRDSIGAEHIKSLFCTSAAEATGIAGPALTICSNLLASGTCGKAEGEEAWIETISTIWDLHLQGSDDTLEVAIHLFRPSATILGKLGSFSPAYEIEAPESLKHRWNSDLEKFMHQNLILPARAAFISHRLFEHFDQALEVSKSIIQLSAPALYFLASGVAGRVAEGELRKNIVEWIKQLFRAIEPMVRGRPDRSTLMQGILQQAIQRSMPVDVEDLRRVSRRYALQGAETDWQLVSKIALCDPDVFQLSDDGAELRREICDRTVKQDFGKGDYDAVSETIGAIMDGFRTRRGFPSFLRLWLEQLCEAERQKLDAQSPWFEVGRSTSPTKALGALVETELSPSQLLDIIAWAETQKPEVHPRSICVFSSTIAQAVRSESFVDAVGRRLFDLVAPLDSSSGVSALKWRVVANTISWIAPDERLELWGTVRDRLANILATAPIISGETFEAFKCCYQAWDSMSPDGARVDEPASLVEGFTERLAAEMAASRLSRDKLQCVEPDTKAELQEGSAFQQYLAWCFYGSSRFSRLYSARKGEMPSILSNSAIRKASVEEQQTLWHALLCNEVNLNEPKIARDVVDRLIAALDDSGKNKSLPGEKGQLWIKTLASIPLEVYNRGQRERVMNALSKRREKMVKSPNRVSLNGWKLVLGLATKMMGRPTFYEAMSFSDLVDIAAAMSSISIESATGSGVLPELIERFFLMASATIRQMAEHIDERSIKYFREASKFVSDCEAQATAQQETSKVRNPFFMTLLKALAAELERLPNCQGHEELGLLTRSSKTALAKCIVDAVRNFVSDKKLLASPSTIADMALLTAIDAAGAVDDLAGLFDFKTSAVRKLEGRSRESMLQGDLRGWKIQVFLRTYLSSAVAIPRPTAYDSLENLPAQLREPLLKELVASVTRNMSSSGRLQYLWELIDAFKKGCDTDGQVLAIQTAVDQLMDSTDLQGRTEEFSLAAAHSELTLSLLRKSPHAAHICRILRTLLEKRPQAMGQWNVDITLSTVCDLSATTADLAAVPFMWLCKLVEVVIKKHRIRLEGHYHILLSAMQALLRNLVVCQPAADAGDELSQASKAQLYARLITLVCEPTAGSVSRAQLHSALDSAVDAAKRSAGRHMYLVLMQYVKLQLEEEVPRAVREALEPAVTSIFDITPPEGRKILNDAMDGSGRAILREMFKRYVKFGKWSGV